MIFGDRNTFAIESEVLKYYRGTAPTCLGFFVIHIGGMEYGVKEYDASMLGNSFGAVSRRLKLRGYHEDIFPNASAIEIASAVDHFLYEGEDDSAYLGISKGEFNHWLYNKEIIWAPDGDEAFDDGSHVLQFDVGLQCRLVAYKRDQGLIVPQSVQEQWLSSADFYNILASWLKAFEANWELAMTYEHDSNANSAVNE